MKITPWPGSAETDEVLVGFRLCRLPEVVSPEAAAVWLSEAEQAEGRRRVHPGSFRNWLAGRLAAKAVWLARAGLEFSADGPGAAAGVEILNAADGAPYLRVGGRRPRGCLSISHTPGLGAAFFSTSRRVGVDVEVAGRPMNPRVARFAFTAEERALAEAAHGGWPGFLGLWCAKEAAAKSWRVGLLNHLAAVRVCGADWAAGRLSVEFSPPAAGRPRAAVTLARFETWLLARATSS